MVKYSDCSGPSRAFSHRHSWRLPHLPLSSGGCAHNRARPSLLRRSMILNFRPVDMTTFEARFNQHLMKIQKMPNNSWKLYVDGTPVKGTFVSARKAME